MATDWTRLYAIRFELDALVANGELTVERARELLAEAEHVAAEDEELAGFLRTCLRLLSTVGPS